MRYTSKIQQKHQEVGHNAPFPIEDTMPRKLEAPQFGLTGYTVSCVIGTNLYLSLLFFFYSVK